MFVELRGLMVMMIAAGVLVSCASAEEASRADATRSSEVTTATVTEPTVTESTVTESTVTDASTADCDVDESAPEDPPEHFDVSMAIEYDVVPPVSGPHRPQWPDITKTLYVSAERPELGELVHSQEHGWTIVWYDETVNPADLGDIEAEIAIAPKIVIVPWTSADGAAFPAGKHVAFTHWEAGTEWRQFCAAADSDAILGFAERHPPTDAHEPSGP